MDFLNNICPGCEVQVTIYVDTDDVEGADTPVAGAASLALSFNGLTDVLSLSRTDSTAATLSTFTLEMRFKVSMVGC